MPKTQRSDFNRMLEAFANLLQITETANEWDNQLIGHPLERTNRMKSSIHDDARGLDGLESSHHVLVKKACKAEPISSGRTSSEFFPLLKSAGEMSLTLRAVPAVP